MRFPAGSRLAEDFRRKARQGRLRLTAQVAWDQLETLGDPMAADYFADQALPQGLGRRNETMYGHGPTSVGPAHTQDVAAHLKQLLREHLPAALACWSSAGPPQSPR